MLMEKEWAQMTVLAQLQKSSVADELVQKFQMPMWLNQEQIAHTVSTNQIAKNSVECV